MGFLIVSFGFLWILRGSKPAPLQRPTAGLARIWREACDLLLTSGLILTLLAVFDASEKTQVLASEYKVLFIGLAAYLISRYQDKAEVFSLAVIAMVFMISLRQNDLRQGLFLAGVVCGGMALFQTGFLGLRYKMLFSPVPVAVKGWPILCLLAAFLSVVFGGVGYLVF